MLSHCLAFEPPQIFPRDYLATTPAFASPYDSADMNCIRALNACASNPQISFAHTLVAGNALPW